jgi:hypothetical protein
MEKAEAAWESCLEKRLLELPSSDPKGKHDMKLPETLPFSSETEKEFDDVSLRVSKVFAAIGREEVDFEISTHSATGCSIDLYIKNYEVIRPTHVEQLLPELQTVLRKYRQYWCVRIWAYKPDAPILKDNTCIWLEINKYAVSPFRGKKEVEIFENMEAFYGSFWT